jgi:chaperonin GroEL
MRWDDRFLVLATIISDEMGRQISSVTLADFGTAKKVIVTKNDCTIIEGAGDSAKVVDRVKNLRVQVEDSSSDYDKEKLQERIAKLSGGVAVINVGAATEVELKEKKDRVVDALSATRAAVEEGIVCGGGLALIQTQKPILALIETLDEDEKVGAKIIAQAVESPMRMIATNAGLEGSVIVEKAKGEKPGIGFNAATLVWEDMMKAGIIDPAKVVRTALQNAASVAGMLSTTEVLITEKPTKEQPNTPQPNLY